MRVLVCGDRNWTDRESIRDQIHRLALDTGNLKGIRKLTIIHGGARGADTLAGNVALEYDFDKIEFLAQWDKYGRAAGPIRNQQMLDEGKPDLVLAFHPDLSKSKGTADMVRRARKAGIPVEVFSR